MVQHKLENAISFGMEVGLAMDDDISHPETNVEVPILNTLPACAIVLAIVLQISLE